MICWKLLLVFFVGTFRVVCSWKGDNGGALFQSSKCSYMMMLSRFGLGFFGGFFVFFWFFVFFSFTLPTSSQIAVFIVPMQW